MRRVTYWSPPRAIQQLIEMQERNGREEEEEYGDEIGLLSGR